MIAIKQSDVGEKNFREIALRGGFGAVGPDPGQLPTDATLDLTGVLDPENKAVDEADKEFIREIIGATPEEVETPQSLAKANSKEALSTMATEAGLDGNSYTSKIEMAEAIIAKRNESGTE